jgi:prolyl-tRNA editing enzyme YbaK/EbsC (Cys-tRNA(Pro) deacylase)
MMVNEIKNSLSPSAQKVNDALVAKGHSYNIVEFQESTRTSAEAAARVGCQIGQIVKSLIFRCQGSGKPALVLTSGANRVDESLISGYTGESIARADADFVRLTTGFAIGGVPPVGYPQPMETYLDEDLLLYDSIWAAAGNPNAVFELTPAALAELTGGKIVRVKP